MVCQIVPFWNVKPIHHEAVYCIPVVQLGSQPTTRSKLGEPPVRLTPTIFAIYINPPLGPDVMHYLASRLGWPK
jgi:hypothetical protein